MNAFGFKEDDPDYIFRPGVYGLMFNEHKDEIAVIQTDGGYYFCLAKVWKTTNHMKNTSKEKVLKKWV